MTRKWRSFAGAAAVGAGAAAVAAYMGVVRRWHLRWGATDDEIAREMPLDDEVTEPTYVTNRAITIRALPQEIWPWLAQMGELPRGGFYSYLTVERLLRMQVENADRILSEFQDPKVGEALDRSGTMRVKAVEPNSYLVLGPSSTPDLAVTWTLALYPRIDGSTRLISRCRARLPRGSKGLFWLAILDPGQFLMERKMLLEIKRRAESRASRFAGRKRSATAKDRPTKPARMS
ncbi:MAG TPA: SRPBCC family protein [Thermoanaerobaculia bacterium]|nr:SRPBCC family protein [Thermoanaerobaculia bacterium]